jgi:acyl carrier protein
MATNHFCPPRPLWLRYHSFFASFKGRIYSHDSHTAKIIGQNWEIRNGDCFRHASWGNKHHVLRRSGKARGRECGQTGICVLGFPRRCRRRTHFRNTGYLTEVLETHSGEIDPDKSFDDYGLDSINAVIATDRIGKQLGIELPPEFLLQNRSVNAIIRALMDQDSPLSSANL